MLEFYEARNRVLALAARLPSERVDLRQARGRVLATSVVSAIDAPGFDNSAMDGYAICAASLADCTREVTLPVIGESRAGVPGPPLANNAAQRIFTGAAIPAHADTVVMQENAVREGDTIRILPPIEPGRHVRQRGEDVHVGMTVIDGGTRLNPFHLSLLASLDQTVVEVVRKPRVAILCTGDELRLPGSTPGPGTLPESNGIALATLAESVGAHASLLPLATDQVEPLTELLSNALHGSDLVLTVGGVSVGDYDVVHTALARAGVQTEFWKVRLRPGKPLAVGTLGRTIVLGLPGNPVSAQVTGCLFVAPLLRTLQGDTRAVAPFVSKRLTAPLAQSPGRRGFYRSVVDGEAVTAHDRQGSGSVLSMAQANALVTLPEDSTGARAGDTVDTLLLASL